MRIVWRDCSPTETIRPVLYQVGYGMCGSADYEYTVTDDLDQACDIAADNVQRYQELGYQLVRMSVSYPAFTDADRAKAWSRVMADANTGRTAFLVPGDTDHPVYRYVDIVPYTSLDSEYETMHAVWEEDRD